MVASLKIVYMGLARDYEKIIPPIQSTFDATHIVEGYWSKTSSPLPKKGTIDGILIDLDQYKDPDFLKDPFAYIETLKKKCSNTTIIGLSKKFNPRTSHFSEEISIKLFEAGLDDGFDPNQGTIPHRIIAERLKNSFRRYNTSTKKLSAQSTTEDKRLFEVGGVTVDLDRHSVTYGDKTLELAPQEFDLVVYLVKNPDCFKQRDQIMDAIYPDNIHVDDRGVDSKIKAIKKKQIAAGFPPLFKTRYGIGYCFMSSKLRAQYKKDEEQKARQKNKVPSHGG